MLHETVKRQSLTLRALTAAVAPTGSLNICACNHCVNYVYAVWIKTHVDMIVCWVLCVLHVVYSLCYYL